MPTESSAQLEHMQYVYILKSTLSDRYYVGSTGNRLKRLGDHNRGRVRSTKTYRPWRLAFSQAYKSKLEARRIEIRLKKLKRKDYLKKIIDDKIIRLGP